MSQLFDIEIERVVLGAFLIDFNTIDLSVLNQVNEGLYYKNENKLVYRAINALIGQSKSIDVLTVTQELRNCGITELEGSPAAYYVSTLTNRLASIGNIAFHVAILKQMFLLRELKKLSLSIENQVNESGADCFEVISYIEKTIATITKFETSTVKHISQIHKEMVAEQKEVLLGNKKTGILSGLTMLDAETGGWQNGNLIILAARPGMGKSAVALQFALNCSVNHNIPSAIISLEMSSYEVGGRIFATQTHLSNTKIIQKKLNAGEALYVENNCDTVNQSPIYIDDSATLNLTVLKNKMKSLFKENGVRLFIVDYLQLLSGDNSNREREVSEISRALKLMAKEFNCPIITLSQLNRSVETRGGDKRPILSDLRDSGSIEQDADIVLFLWRPAVYNLYENGYQYGNMTLEQRDLLMIDIAKGRGIRICEVPAKFYGEQMIVKDY